MGFVNAVVIGAYQGANHQHGRTRGSHEAGQHSSNGQQTGIECRTAVEIAPYMNATGDSEQGREQQNEGDVLGKQGMHQADAGFTGSKHRGKGQKESQCPGCGHFAKVVVPKMRRQQGHQCNGQEQAGKRHPPDRLQLAAIKVGCVRQLGDEQAKGE